MIKQACFAIITTFTALILAACGSGGGPSAPATIYNTTAYSTGTYYNPSAHAATVIFGGSAGLSPAPAKALDLMPGNTVDAVPLRKTNITVGGCLELAAATSDIKVCYEDSAMQPFAVKLNDLLPGILVTVTMVIGSPGPVDILVAHVEANSNYSGVYNNGTLGNRTIVVTVDNTTSYLWFKGETGHELTHAAYQYAGGDLTQPWLNEAIASLTEYEMKVYKDTGTPWNGLALNAQPQTSLDYERSQAIGLVVHQLGNYPFGPALSQPDPLKAITGLALPDFAKYFWTHTATEDGEHIPVAAGPNAATIPAYGAVRLSGPATSTSDLFDLQ